MSILPSGSGLPAEEIERIVAGSSAPGWSRHEGAIIKAVEELFTRFQISDATWAVLAESWSEQQLLEFPILVGVYAATAMQQNSIRFATLRADNTGLTTARLREKSDGNERLRRQNRRARGARCRARRRASPRLPTAR